MRVPRYNYRAQFDDLPSLTCRIARSLEDGDYVLTDSVAGFEDRFADYIGTENAIGVGSGTDALILGLTALDIGPGDEVVTVANTFHATVLAITTVGATPVLVDCDHDSHLMDLAAVRAACTSRTRAILAVHLFGRSLDMDQLTTVAADLGIAVIEDCAQAVGARWRDRRVGSIGSIGCFSFHPSKNLAAAGDAGAVTTNDPDLARTVRVLRSLGQDGQNNHVRLGMNSKLDALQALVLNSKLDHLDTWNQSRRQIARRYIESCRDSGLVVSCLPEPPGDHVYHLFQVCVRDRDTVLNRLRANGIDAVVRYPTPIHRQPAFAAHHFHGDFPNAEYQAANTLALPIRPDMSDADVEFVCTSLHAALSATEETQP
ncbi:DegT/DnrJ/EryC1/StrS family aminotransferase [Nocardia suismassiliense]|uniref:DegT/DnrJ/EryC1/StrS family aminotransferase n=1 Tax=Nocardia suismassiliense TaxID=2077092 RepID=A0ABW6QT66_9NOCA